MVASPKEAPPPAILIDPQTSVSEPRLYQVIGADGSVVGTLPDLDNDAMLGMYRSMLLIRALDERMMILQRQGRIGFYGACTGQEAGPIGTAAALRPTDWIFPGLREGAAMLHRGYPLETYVNQVLGNDGDVLKGRQMPSHYADKSVRQVSWSSVIGPQITQAVGAAWAARYMKSGEITVGFMGDGATSSADFHTGMNFAAVWRAPCILICQNNHWSISVPTKSQTASRTIAEKAIAYGMPYARVDGNDALAVYAAVSEAARRARNGEGPAFLELLTYRIGAHSSSDDPRVYRDEREVDEWKLRDPLLRFKKFLIESGRWSDEQDGSTRDLINLEILDAVERAERRPPPPRSTLFEDVYAQPPWHLREQARELEDDGGSD